MDEPVELAMRVNGPVVSYPQSASDGRAKEQGSAEGIARPSDAAVENASVGMNIKRTRKGFSKSRTGCLNCKKARVKCKENHPSCTYCTNRGLNCVWPEIQIIEARSQAQNVRYQLPSVAIQVRGPVSNMVDCRLFDHFIKAAYPHHPLNNDSVWTHEIPSISSDYDFLLDSMLALAASDLVASTPSDSSLIYKAMAHRVKAISSLNAAVAGGITSFEQGNAMLATCFVLLFQSVLMSDGLVEYMTFIRGCVVVGFQLGIRRIKFLFEGLWGDDNIKELEPGLKAMPLLDAEAVSGACRSMEKFSGLCQSRVELNMYGLILGTARSLFTSSCDGYMQLRKIYENFANLMSHEDFRELTNPSNEVGRILLAHFVALQLLMNRISRVESAERRSREEPNASQGPPDGTTVRWLGHLHSKISPGFVKYYQWTMLVEREVYEGRMIL